jgi:glycosyltransferase involved in cell wall biosynthesis
VRILAVTAPLPAPGRVGSLAPVARQLESLRQLGVEIEVVELRGSPRARYLWTLPVVRRRARAVDLVHGHFGYCGWLARAQLSRPVVVSFMGDDVLGRFGHGGRATAWSRGIAAANRLLARSADAVIVKSEAMAARLAAVGPHLIPNGVDLDAFRPADPVEARRRLGWPDAPHVLFGGNPAFPNKGFGLARAAADAAARRLGAPLELRVLWDVAPERVPDHMNACSALLFTSFSEGSPNVVKEAMACDLPVVSVAVGDVPSLVRGVAGCAVCARDPEALGAALADVVRAGRRAAGRGAIERRGLGLPDVARRILMVYQGVLDARRKNR